MAKKKRPIFACAVCGLKFFAQGLRKIKLQKPFWDAKICLGCRGRARNPEDPTGGAGKQWHLRVAITGNYKADLECAIDEVLRHVNQGHHIGHNQNENYAYLFSIEENDRCGARARVGRSDAS